MAVRESPGLNDLASAVSEHPEGSRLRINLQPRSSRDKIGRILAGELKVHVTAPPVDDAANEKLIELLSSSLRHPRGSVRLIRGAASRHKTVHITGLTAAEVRNRLGLASMNSTLTSGKTGARPRRSSG